MVLVGCNSIFSQRETRECLQFEKWATFRSVYVSREGFVYGSELIETPSLIDELGSKAKHDQSIPGGY